MATWLSFAISRPGPGQKVGYQNRTIRSLGEVVGEVKHSMEGSLETAFGELDNPMRQASWTFSVSKAGKVYQHYPLEYITWHAGYDANLFHVGIEHEGVAGEPLTEEQYQGTLRISRALRELCPAIGRVTPNRKANLREHNEFMATACPSGRIPWDRLIADLLGETGESMDQETFNQMVENYFLEAYKGTPGFKERFFALEEWTRESKKRVLELAGTIGKGG